MLSPQRRSFNSGCQVTQTAAKDEVNERASHDKGSRTAERERDSDGPARDRTREQRGNDHRGERSLHDRALDKEDLSVGPREGRRRDGATDLDERGRRVGSGRIMTRGDRERGVIGDEFCNNDRMRNERPREQNTIDRTMHGDYRDRAIQERRSLIPEDRFDRREIGREDGREIGSSRPRFAFRGEREREFDGPRDRLRRDIEQTDAEFERVRGRDSRGGDWHEQKVNEHDGRNDRISANQINSQGVERHQNRNERKERNLEYEKEEQRYKRDYQFANDGVKSYHQDTQNGAGYQQRYQGGGYGRRDRGGSRFHHRRSETEEPEWMSESVQMGELMELRGFDDSPEKDVFPHASSVGKYIRTT